MRRAARVDGNHAAVRRGLEQIGATVIDLAAVGGGCPDMLVGYQGRNLLLEIKDGSKSPSQRRMTTAQLELHASWRGQCAVVESVEQAIDYLQKSARNQS